MSSEPPRPTPPASGPGWQPVQPPPPATPSPSSAGPGQPGPFSPRPGLLLPAVLILGGVVALLVNVGAITGDQLLRLLDLWPLALILLGLAMIFRVSLPRYTVPATVALVLLAIAVSFVYTSMPSVLPSMLTSTSQQADYSAPLGSGVESGRLQLGLGGRATIDSAGISDLYKAHMEFPRDRPPSVSASGGTVTIENGERSFPLFGRGTLRAQVTLNNSIPWDVNLQGGASSVTLDLSGLKLTSLGISGGASQVEATLPSPTGQASVHISGGASQVTIHRPTGVAIRVHMSGGASNLEIDGTHHNVIGGDADYQTPDWNSASARYDMEISGGASNVRVDTR
jgi:hypothetical protein